MLKRQRALLTMLHEAGGTATRLQVMKWAFLVSTETPSRGGSTFYQFLPYKYGPYSFCLYQEAAALVRDGMIEEVGERAWRLCPAGLAASRRLDGEVSSDIAGVLTRFPKSGVKQIVEYVYDRYQWFTLNSDQRPRVRRPTAKPAVYTAGYEGLLVDGFLNGLLRCGIRRLLDVRNNPISRRYGFHKSTLSRLCGYVGLEYEHLPQLGIESVQRQGLDSPGVRAALLARYERSMLPAHRASVDSVASMMTETPSVLVCMEADPAQCHRSRLAKAVAQVAELPISHLELVG